MIKNNKVSYVKYVRSKTKQASWFIGKSAAWGSGDPSSNPGKIYKIISKLIKLIELRLGCPERAFVVTLTQNHRK